jgi:hypothetical protein
MDFAHELEHAVDGGATQAGGFTDSGTEMGGFTDSGTTMGGFSDTPAPDDGGGLGGLPGGLGATGNDLLQTLAPALVGGAAGGLGRSGLFS